MNKITFEDLPSTKSPINANNLNQVQTNVENSINERLLKPFIMWTNPNPNVAFEKQYIKLSTDDYDMYEVFYKEIATNSLVLSQKGIAQKSVILSVNYGYENQVVTRGFYRVQGKNNEFNVEVAYFGGNKTANNSYCIPLYVVGYKTGLNLS